MSFFDDVVLLLGDLGLVVVADAPEQVARDVELLGHAHERLVGVDEQGFDVVAGRARHVRRRSGRRRCAGQCRASRSRSGVRAVARGAGRRVAVERPLREVARRDSRDRRSPRTGRREARGRRRPSRRPLRGTIAPGRAPASTRAARPSIATSSPRGPVLRIVTTRAGVATTSSSRYSTRSSRVTARGYESTPSDVAAVALEHRPCRAPIARGRGEHLDRLRVERGRRARRRISSGVGSTRSIHSSATATEARGRVGGRAGATARRRRRSTRRGAAR